MEIKPTDRPEYEEIIATSHLIRQAEHRLEKHSWTSMHRRCNDIHGVNPPGKCCVHNARNASLSPKAESESELWTELCGLSLP
jgi:hypothetical protein